MTPNTDTVPSAEDWRRAVDWVEAQYPPAVFPPDSDSLDARSGTFARHVCRNIRKEARRIMDARSEGPLHCTAYAEDGGCGREECPRCGPHIIPPETGSGVLQYDGEADAR
jgi:hypothetical protein